MTIREKFNSLTLEGIKSVKNTFSNLDDNITIGELNCYLDVREKALTDIKTVNDKRMKEMIGKYFIIKYDNHFINAKELVIMAHLADYNEFTQSYICKCLKKYGESYEYVQCDSIAERDFEDNSLSKAEEISKSKFDEILDKYRDLQSSI